MKTLFLLLTVLLLTCVADARAEGGLRGRIKERIAERLKEAPAPVPDAATTAPIKAPGDYTFTLPHDGLTRAYLVHVPAGYKPGKPVPVVFAFHGGGGDMGYMARDDYYGLITTSDREGFVVVFPNGYSRFKSGKLATWNAGACCGDARDRNIDDVGFIRKIVETLGRQMPLDRKRIYATGISNGGLMSYRLACELPGIFRAIAPVAGTDNTLQCPSDTPVSVLHIHARNDTHVLFEGGAGPGSFRDESKVTDFTSVPDTIARWVKRNHCSPVPQNVLKKPGVSCERYSGCDDGTAVQLCVTETGGHSWPGGHKPRSDEPPSDAISANDMMWTFFEELD